MCGLGGLWHRDGAPASHDQLRRMMTALRHRGPEGAASARLDGGSLELGFVRLGFTGGGACQQPLFDGSGALALVHNGEVYGHARLRAELQRRGHHFQTESDSETILHLFAEHGDDAFARLNGEFAFALWDARTRTLRLVRDRFGTKPLFFAWHRGALVFASEAKGLLALAGFPVVLEPRWHRGAGVGLPELAQSAFRGVRSVLPGHVLTVTPHGCDERRWWRPTFGGPRLAHGEAVARVRAQVEASVARRLEGEPPIALSLSSGLDSSVLASVLSRVAPKTPAFCLGWPQRPFDESRQAEQTARALGLPFHRVTCTTERLADGFLASVHATETATNSLSTVARLELTRAVRAHGFKALLTGEGSDELFGGYPYFGLEAITRAGDRGAARRFATHEARARGVLWEWPIRSPVLDLPTCHARRVERLRQHTARLFHADWLARAGPLDSDAEIPTGVDPAWLARQTPFDQTRVVAGGMLGAVLIPALGDRLEMAASLEGRLPYLDAELVALTHALDEQACIEPGTFRRKRVLQDAFAVDLPPGFEAPPKHTLMAPSFRALHRTDAGRALISDLSSDAAVRRAGVFSRAAVRGLVTAWRLTGKADPLVGFVLGTQALHAVFLERALGELQPPRSDWLELEDRTPPPALERAGGTR